MLGGATQAMPVCIVEERQQRRRPLAATPLRAAARRPAGCVARSLHTTTGMLVARALPAGLGGGQQQSANVILWRALRQFIWIKNENKDAAKSPDFTD